VKKALNLKKFQIKCKQLFKTLKLKLAGFKNSNRKDSKIVTKAVYPDFSIQKIS